MNGISITSAPTARNPSVSTPACSRARETNIRQPERGSPLKVAGFVIDFVFGVIVRVELTVLNISPVLWLSRRYCRRSIYITQNLVAPAAKDRFPCPLAELYWIAPGLYLADHFRTVGPRANTNQPQDSVFHLGECAIL